MTDAQLLQEVEAFEASMVGNVTGGMADASEKTAYKDQYYVLRKELEQRDVVFPHSFSTVDQLWAFYKSRFDNYADRRAHIAESFQVAESTLRSRIDSKFDARDWNATNEMLVDELVPVRRQWLKAKRYIIGPPVDPENSIKESILAVESAAKILFDRPKDTLGQIAGDGLIDPDVGRLIKQAYGFISNRPGVRHGQVTESNESVEEATYFLDFAAITIRYLKNKKSPPIR